jgi:hypothetical protein
MSKSFNSSASTNAPATASQRATISNNFDQSHEMMTAVSNDSQEMELVDIFNKFMKKANDISESTV